MARVKSGFRKRFNIRYLRWAAAHATIGQFAFLRRIFSFYPRAVLPQQAITEVIEDRIFNLPTHFSQSEAGFVSQRCWTYDTFAGTWRGEPFTQARQSVGLIPNATFFGHVSRVFDPRHQAVLMVEGSSANWNFAKARRLRCLETIKGRCHLLARTDNYYHALFHDLVPLVDYLDRLHTPGTELTLVIPQTRLATLRLGCELIASSFTGVHCVEIADDSRIPVESALWISLEAGNAEWTFAEARPVQLMADLFRRHYNVRPGNGRRLFFSRGNSKIRRLLNEEALWTIAHKYGFEKFEARHDNHNEQVEYFSQASIVIGVHGAGLGNLAFCQKGTTVLELFPDNFTKSTYLWLCRHMGLDYDFLIGSAGDYNQSFTLDEKQFENKLVNMLAAEAATKTPP